MPKKKPNHHPSTAPPQPQPQPEPEPPRPLQTTLAFHPKKRDIVAGPKKRDIVTDFNNYFGNTSNLENWQQLCQDVGLEDYYPSITQCRLALKPVWVNIHDLLDAHAKGEIPRRFDSEGALARYTIKKRRFFPRAKAKAGGPARVLLAHIF